MKAKLTRDYTCSPDGIHLEKGYAGDVVEGQFAIYALSDKAAIEYSEQRPQVAKTPAPEIKKKRRK